MAVGRILRPHGVRGDLLVEVVPDLVNLIDAETVVYLGPRRRRRIVRSLRPHGQQYLLSLEGCVDRQSAEAWRAAQVYVRLKDLEPLPSGVYYDWQIVGLEARTEAGETLGRVSEIIRTGANDVYLVKSESGEELLLPALDSVILRVDLEEGRMWVRLLRGLRQEES